MRIHDPNISGSQVHGTNRADAAAGAEQGHRAHSGQKAGAPSDQVQLSNLSSSLRALDSESPERSAYLERLAAEVSSGRYNPDPIEVSRKIVSEALESDAPPEVKE